MMATCEDPCKSPGQAGDPTSFVFREVAEAAGEDHISYGATALSDALARFPHLRAGAEQILNLKPSERLTIWIGIILQEGLSLWFRGVMKPNHQPQRKATDCETRRSRVTASCPWRNPSRSHRIWSYLVCRVGITDTVFP
jgi:hypothetical protein